MWLILVLSVFLSLLLLAVGLLIYARWHFGSLEKQGIPVVKPHHFVLGGARLSFQLNGGLLDIKHMKEYGPYFGLYEGRQPQIFICDPDLIRRVTIKDAAHFNARRPLQFGDKVLNEFMDFQVYTKWKTMKQMISPLMTNLARIKNAGTQMRAAIDDYVGSLKKQINESDGRLQNYDLDAGVFEMLSDLIARSQLSMNFGDSDLFKRYVASIKAMTRPPAAKWPRLSAYVYSFPFLRKVLPNATINPELFKEFINFPKQLLETRRLDNLTGKRRATGKQRDLLDFLLKWHDDITTNPHSKYAKNGVTEMSIYNFGSVLFLGGQHQISLIISALMYHLADDPAIQEKLLEEVDEALTQNNGVIDHNILSEMNFLNACVLEATRLYPFFFRAERLCTKDWEDRTRGIKIKRGDLVQIAIWATNRNPDYWEDPDRFIPERFLPENKENVNAYAYASFGFGPRNCLGKGMALEIMGMLTAHLVKELRFVKREDTEIRFLPMGPFFGAHAPILFDVELRELTEDPF